MRLNNYPFPFTKLSDQYSNSCFPMFSFPMLYEYKSMLPTMLSVILIKKI